MHRLKEWMTSYFQDGGHDDCLLLSCYIYSSICLLPANLPSACDVTGSLTVCATVPDPQYISTRWRNLQESKSNIVYYCINGTDICISTLGYQCWKLLQRPAMLCISSVLLPNSNSIEPNAITSDVVRLVDTAYHNVHFLINCCSARISQMMSIQCQLFSNVNKSIIIIITT